MFSYQGVAALYLGVLAHAFFFPVRFHNQLDIMKIIVSLLVALAFPALAQTNQTDLIATNGAVYKNYHLEKVLPSGLLISFTPTNGGFGITTVRFDSLDTTIQKKYGYDPQKAAQFEGAQAQANADLKVEMTTNLENYEIQRAILYQQQQAELQREEARAEAERQAEAQQQEADALMKIATNPPPPPPPAPVIIQQQQQNNIIY